MLRKYKYYLRKPKGEITKDILLALFVGGMLIVGGSSTAAALWRSILQRKKYPRKKFCDTFTRLHRKGLVAIEQQGHRVRVALTPEGKKLAGYMQIDRLEIKRPQKWDGMWRLILFDIPNLKNHQRNAFRGTLEELGFLPLQKSVWVHAFDCVAEIELLKDFFGLREEEVRFILAKNIGSDNLLRKHFQL
ncbi:MAG: hypothetical protein A2842_00655 [Candidatus Wildermuthbacteria bacterium RIFCSPHIGHO2_01_FULL_48_25]|uniref:Transcriptional repressor PaaX-like central Cas2-like domain-containing protein n=1 Tax=Candidatus Wildermuthbacteria bacterium RIFCSPLOWO2_01_FULL_48_16 TaxID=1802461 RepID=A0A1G2RLA4_9BACT|nr:MAG: hypothetical protein A2842_00655 [Candidatus Wildermuthbacteria bacterium RIFCSPHIGHO2_01_FULL_48_25]OHA68272.1 MAG: hypothetical protein A3J57_00450 [Candidatus Wildermuthbacteria bacterium RIFCSPHIGHO2_02_FULL_49_12b]OHA73062.1 MAG: hypothetical protein A3B24_01465 [Candidatus Wildermuthbacteria bacterium RIFCSPLOWO2_01_FULL_48_16]